MIVWKALTKEIAGKISPNQNENTISCHGYDSDNFEECDDVAEKDTDQFENIITEKDISDILNYPFSPRELLYTQCALDIGTATEHREDFSDETTTAIGNEPALVLPNTAVFQNTMETAPSVSLIPPSRPDLSHFAPIHLNDNQKMVYDIVCADLHSFLNGVQVLQKLMIVHGQGVTAMSGVAASLINGQTLHSWAGLPTKMPLFDKWLSQPSNIVTNKHKYSLTHVLWLVSSIQELTAFILPFISEG
ncbi:hypothetical protein EI94DRAFT_1702903 [Lactarius quietus]|nr:hypothetical protein EI94DRAFT_1702903 [Lactarius quietus]